MRNLLALFGLLVLVVAGVGSSQGWYQLEKHGSTPDGKVQLQLELDPGRIEYSAKKGLQWAGDTLHDLSTKIGEKEEGKTAFKHSVLSLPSRPGIPRQ